MLIRLETLFAMKVAPEAARAVLLPLNLAADQFGISTEARICGFLAQCAHETRLFTAFKEDLFYRDADRLAQLFTTFNGDPAAAQPYVGKPEKLANRIYANKYGNGDEASGDGWRYRGRGAIHLTFAANYKEAGEGCHRLYLQQPDLLLQLEDACLSAAWFWAAKGGNQMMDQGHFTQATRMVNPGMVGAQERQSLYEAALSSYH